MATDRAFEFTSRDFDTNLASLIDSIKREAPDKWNSMYEGDLGKLLLDHVAYDFSILSFINDAAALESFLDTHRTRESQLHFANQSGYKIRGATAALVEVYCRASTPPQNASYHLIKGGTKVRSTNGLVWEVARDSYIEPGKFTPVKRVVGYGDIKGTATASNGVVTVTDAAITIAPGSSQAILTDLDGRRFSSEVNFGLVSDGSILKLTASYVSGSFTNPPDTARDEYAIIGIGKLQHDAYDGSVLFLDRAWSGDAPFIGKWVIENRNIELVQGETHTESFPAPASPETRAGWSVRSAFYPVIFAPTEQVIPAGFFGSAFGDEESNSGVSVYVNGMPWRETSNLIFEGPTAKAYEIRFDELSRATIKFGDGKFGAILPVGSTVSIKYRVGGGRDGNVMQGSFSTSVPSYGTQGSVPVYLTNPYTVGRGGQDRESLDAARANIKAFIRANDRAVGSVDYNYLASNFVDPGGGRIKLARSVLHANTVPREQNLVWVYTWAEGSGGQLVKPNSGLKRRLKDYLDKRKMLCDEVIVLDGQTTNVPVSFRYKYSISGDQLEVEEKVRAAINRVFVGTSPGESLLISRLYEAMEAIKEVEWVTFHSPFENIPPDSEFRLLVNSIQPGESTPLSASVDRDALLVPVSDASIFVVDGLVSIFELDRAPSSCRIASISGNNLLLRPETPVSDAYSTSAVALNTDWYPVGWQYEKPINVYVVYDTMNGGGLSFVADTIKKKLYDYFTKVLLPEHSLTRAAIQALIASINGITAYEVNLGGSDSAIEYVSATPREKITLGRVIINGIEF